MSKHVSTIPQQAAIYDGLHKADQQSVLVDGDLSSLAAAKTAVTADTDKLHVSQRYPLEQRAHKALEAADNYLTGYTSGTDVSDYDALDSAAQFDGLPIAL